MDGLAARASCTAEDCKLVETKLAKVGIKVSKDEKGGLDSSRDRSSDDNCSLFVRSGGRSNNKSNNSSGKAVDAPPVLLRLPVTLGSGGTADDMA